MVIPLKVACAWRPAMDTGIRPNLSLGIAIGNDEQPL
jgi:hypothetical protein